MRAHVRSLTHTIAAIVTPAVLLITPFLLAAILRGA